MGLSDFLRLLCCRPKAQDLQYLEPEKLHKPRPPVWSDKKPRRRASADRYAPRQNVDIEYGSFPMLSGLRPTTAPIVVPPKPQSVRIPHPPASIISRPGIQGPSKRIPVPTRGRNKRTALTPHTFIEPTGYDRLGVKVNTYTSPVLPATPAQPSPLVIPSSMRSNDPEDHDDLNDNEYMDHEISGATVAAGVDVYGNSSEYYPTAANMNNTLTTVPRQAKSSTFSQRRTSPRRSSIAREAPRRVLHTEPHEGVIDERGAWSWGRVNFGQESASFNIGDMARRFDDLAARGRTSYRP